MAKKRATKTTLKGPTRKRWRRVLIKEIAAGASMTDAAVKAGVDRKHAYAVIKNDPAFKALYEDAIEQSVDILETAARARAVDGVEQVVVHNGEAVFVHVNTRGQLVPADSKSVKFKVPLMKREYSDGLLMRLLAGRRPTVYGDRMSLRAETPAKGTEQGASNALREMIELINASTPQAPVPPDPAAPKPKESK